MVSVDQGPTTRMGARRSGIVSPKIPASGPTPAVPSSSVGQYAGQSMPIGTDKGSLTYFDQTHINYTPHWAYYKMRGQDHGTNGLYDTWIVIGFADSTGAQYTGGLATPLRDVTIAASWSG